MKYVTLLRGVNVGGNKKVDMKSLKIIFESLGCENVITHINSGNIIFDSKESKSTLTKNIATKIKKEFGFEVPIVVKTKNEIQTISRSIPKNWLNNSDQKTDVAYLFQGANSKLILSELPVKKEYVEFICLKDAIIWNIKKKELAKSQLNKVAGHKLYQQMTVRNVNTARKLSLLVQE